MLAVLQFYQAYVSPFVRFAVPSLAILVLWVGLRRAGLTLQTRRTGFTVTAVLLVWFVTMDQLTRAGIYSTYWDTMRLLCWAVAIGLVIPMLRSKHVGAALDAIPSSWLIGLQVYRTLAGFVWLATWSTGRLPSWFGLTAGIGDSLVGILAVAAALAAHSGSRGGRIAGIAWNAFGIADFVMGFVLASYFPYTIPYPGVMIPAFLAPLSLNIHVLSIWQLLRAHKRADALATAAAY